MSTNDKIYRVLFAHPRMVHDLLLAFVPVAKPETLDFESLQRVNTSQTSDKGHRREQDMVWKVRLADQWLYVYLMLEFQSESDPWMALRMQVYVGTMYQELIRSEQLTPRTGLPPVLPVVLYNGKNSWQAETDLEALLQPAPPHLKSLQPAQRYVVIDESIYAADVLDSKANLVAALFRLEHARAEEDIGHVFAKLDDWLKDPKYNSLRGDFARTIIWLLRRRARNSKIPDISNLTEIKAMYAKRRLDWWEEWMAEGVVKGEVQLLRRQLARRFGDLPDWVEAKLSAASEDQLTRWGEAVVDSQKTLDQIFLR